MNRTEQGIAHYLGEERLRYLQTVTVGIAGCGGLGSNCAMHLVRSGFRRFVLVDDDRIEPSNLNRQAYAAEQVGRLKAEALRDNMRSVNPDVDIKVCIERATGDSMVELFSQCDVIVEAFDRVESKKALVEQFISTDKVIVTASGIGGYGDTDALCSRQVRENLYMIGDMQTVCNAEQPPLSPRVGIAAAKQADAVLSHYLQQYENQGGVK